MHQVPWSLVVILGAVSLAAIFIELHVGLRAGSDKIFRLYGRAWFVGLQIYSDAFCLRCAVRWGNSAVRPAGSMVS